MSSSPAGTCIVNQQEPRLFLSSRTYYLSPGPRAYWTFLKRTFLRAALPARATRPISRNAAPRRRPHVRTAPRDAAMPTTWGRTVVNKYLRRYEGIIPSYEGIYKYLRTKVLYLRTFEGTY